MWPLYALKYYFMLGIKSCVLLGLRSGCRYSLLPLRHLRRSFEKCENQMWAVAIYIVRTQREREIHDVRAEVAAAAAATALCTLF